MDITLRVLHPLHVYILNIHMENNMDIYVKVVKVVKNPKNLVFLRFFALKIKRYGIIPKNRKSVSEWLKTAKKQDCISEMKA